MSRRGERGGEEVEGKREGMVRRQGEGERG